MLVRVIMVEITGNELNYTCGVHKIGKSVFSILFAEDYSRIIKSL